ncbi:hypothetical protein [Streptomyces chattanoogensis]|uniref:hypothetical protein n=1 Tax=Streptomyces chattanoogensis TaxID=66876 RepID=UPI00369A5755
MPRAWRITPTEFRLDSIAASGTNHIFKSIRLADGHALTLNTQPGADHADEVCLPPGLTAPDTEAWENQDQWEEWLTGGNLGGGGGLFLDVPIQAIRNLIKQHGGEHENQESNEPRPDPEHETDEQAAPNLLTRLADLRGRFNDGYTADDVRSVFGRISNEGGPYLVCLWDNADEYGFDGNSQFYAETEGAFYEISPDIHQWLSGAQETPGPVETWVCAPVAEPFEFAVSDDFHNYARSGG